MNTRNRDVEIFFYFDFVLFSHFFFNSFSFVNRYDQYESIGVEMGFFSW